MRKTDVVIEVLLEFLSPTTAIGSTEYDDKAYRNLQNICYVHDYCYDLIKDNAELQGNEYSVKRSREYAIKHLKESIENMTDLLKDLEGSEEFKVDQPQETVTEFADRCRECGKMKRCKDCRYFEYNSVANVDGIPLIVAHEICSKWGDGCKTSEDGYCFLFEPKEEEREVDE